MTSSPRLSTTLICALLATLAFVPSALADSLSWVSTGSLNNARSSAGSALLPNGKVLVVSGQDATNTLVATSELYDPASHSWTQTGTLNTPRSMAVTTQLADGRVLVAGGIDAGGFPNGALRSAELYDPATGTWSPTGDFKAQRHDGAVSTLLPNGKVFLVGAQSQDDAQTGYYGAELYDPATGTWALAKPAVQNDRYYAAVAPLPDGRVLVAGGLGGAGTFASAELYDPASDTWSATGSMTAERAAVQAIVLKNGKVLVAGGIGPNSTVLQSAEIYDPATGKWAPTGPLSEPRWQAAQAMRLDGKVVAAGGITAGLTASGTADLYDPSAGTWTSISPLNEARGAATATLLQNGDMLVAGGLAGSLFGPAVLKSSELLTEPVPNPVLSLAAPTTATVGGPLPPSSIVATIEGGFNPTGTIAFEVFGPQADPPTSCDAGGVTAGTTKSSLGRASVSGPGKYSPEVGFTPAAPGHYWWYASFSGNGSSKAQTTTCGPGMAEMVVPAAAAAAAAPVQEPTVAKPVLKRLKISPKAFPTAARRGKKKRKLGARITYTDSAKATATLTVLRRGKRVAKFKHRDVASINKIAFSGKFKRKALAPGRYVLKASATNSAGTSKAISIKFTVRK